MIIGEVSNTPEFRKNKDGDRIVVMVDCEIQSIGDLRPVEMRFSGGEYTIPQIHDDIFIDDSNDNWLIGYTSSDINDVLSSLNPGDKMFYSKSKEPDEKETESTPAKIFQSIRQAWIKLFADGEIEAQATDGDLEIPKDLGHWILKNDGEASINSTDDQGVIKATTDWKPNGDIEFNGNTGNLSEHAKMKIELEELKSAHNSHTHDYIPGVLPPVSSGLASVQSAANFDNAKIDDLKVKKPT